MVSEELIHGEINRISNNYVQYASWFSDYNEAPKKLNNPVKPGTI
jgi:hypothetical protein